LPQAHQETGYRNIKNVSSHPYSQSQGKKGKKGPQKYHTGNHSGMSDGLMMLSQSTAGYESGGSKNQFRNNIELLNHQQKLQMHLLEAAQFKKKYQMKKNAIDGMMTQMSNTNHNWAQDPHIPSSIGILRVGGIAKPQMSLFNNDS